MTIYIVDPTQSVVLEDIGSLQVINKSVIMSVAGATVTIGYVDAAAAQIGYDDILAALNALNPPADFSIGDWVYIQFPVDMRDGKSYQLQIKKLPSDKAPYWVLQDLATTKFWAVSSAVTLIKVLPVNLPT